MLLRAAISLSLFVMSFPSTATAQRERGEVRVEVRDPQGATVAGEGELVCELNEVRRECCARAAAWTLPRRFPSARLCRVVRHAGDPLGSPANVWYRA